MAYRVRAGAGSQVGPFRRTSTPHDHALFTRRWLARRNAQNSVGNVRTPARTAWEHRFLFWANTRAKAAQAGEALLSQGSSSWALRAISGKLTGYTF